MIESQTTDAKATESATRASHRPPRPVMRSVGLVEDRQDLDFKDLGVVLVRGPLLAKDRSFNSEATPSIGMAYVAGYARKRGYDVTFVDGVGEGLTRLWSPESLPGYYCQGLTVEEIIGKVPKNAKVIGISGMFSGEWPMTRVLIHALREKFPEALLVGGGEHITALPDHSLREAPLDLCVRGEGEHTFFELLECVYHNYDWRTVDGVGYIDENDVYQETSGLPRIADIDNISWPYWPEGYLEKFWEAGKSFGVQTERDMPMMVSRGCPFQCTFCSNPAMWTTRYTLRSVEDVIAEIKLYVDRFGITAIQLYDLTAIIKKDWTLAFCQRLKEERIKVNWSLPSGTRSEALDREVLTLLKDSGCNYLVYAPESGSLNTLRQIKKKISLKTLTESVITAKQIGLVVRTNLIIGFPHESRLDVFKTIRYGLGLALKGVDEVSINIFSPYPGTELFEAAVDTGTIVVEDKYFLQLSSLNSDYTSFNPLTLNLAMSSRELAVYRLLFMMMNYVIGYLIHPSRILRTWRAVFSSKDASTVFEHRLKDAFARKKIKNRSVVDVTDRPD